jgi:hypothetical protein
VWWIPAQDPRQISGRIAELGARLGITSGTSVGETMRMVLEMLRQGMPYRRWLLIFDNVTAPDDIRDFLPQGPGHAVLTSLNPAGAENPIHAGHAACWYS